MTRRRAVPAGQGEKRPVRFGAASNRARLPHPPDGSEGRGSPRIIRSAIVAKEAREIDAQREPPCDLNVAAEYRLRARSVGIKIAVRSVRALRNEQRARQIPANRRANLADSRGNPRRESAERVAAEGCQGRARSRRHTPLPIGDSRTRRRERVSVKRIEVVES